MEFGECPLAAVDRRLSDLHRQWHLAEEAYFDPDAFRVAIQNAIQTARTVTFILQANKAVIPSFESWYEGWRERFRTDPLMRWMVDARNRIEKQGDLASHSWVRAEIIASHLDEGPVVQVPAELFEAPWKLVKSIPDNLLGAHIRQHGTLRVVRRWLENSLPDTELLEAVALTYGKLSAMVDDAHRQIGRYVTTIHGPTGAQIVDGPRGGRLPCMIGHEEGRASLFSLVDGRPGHIEEGVVRFDPDVAEAAVARYGFEGLSRFTEDATLEDQMRALFDVGKTMMSVDGRHMTALFVFAEGKMVAMLDVIAFDTSDKYLLMRRIADRVVQVGGDAVIMISEVWTAAYDPTNPYGRAADSPQREELLVATLVRKDGHPAVIASEITRDGDKTLMGENIAHEDYAAFAFAPLYHAWGKPIPPEWLTSLSGEATGDGGSSG